MNQPKRYRLMQNLEIGKLGDIYRWNGAAYSNETRTASALSEMVVENHPQLFEEVKDTELRGFGYSKLDDRGCWEYYFTTTSSITSEKLKGIKEAIEGVLNPKDIYDGPELKGMFIDEAPQYKRPIEYKSAGNLKFPEPKKYTQASLNEAERLAFSAARKTDVNSFSHPDQRPYPIYPTFEDYKKSLQFGKEVNKWQHEMADAILRGSPTNSSETTVQPAVQEQEDNGWSIISFIWGKERQILFGNDKYGHPEHKGTNTLQEMLEAKEWQIEKVMRLSDNTIFSIGDIVDHVNHKGMEHPIKEFTVKDGSMFASGWGLNYINKVLSNDLKPSTTPQPPEDFKWTDELVEEFAREYEGADCRWSPGIMREEIAKFKKSKTQQ